MTAPDFAAIIEDALLENSWHTQRAGHLLAAKVPELCQTCGGSELVAKPLRPGAQALSATHTDCPDCPTIGQLLAIGAAVLSAVQCMDDLVNVPGVGTMFTPMELLEHLRAVQP